MFFALKTIIRISHILVDAPGVRPYNKCNSKTVYINQPMVVINLTKVNIKSGNYLDEVNHNQGMAIFL